MRAASGSPYARAAILRVLTNCGASIAHSASHRGFVSDDDRPILRLLWADRSFDTGLRAFGLTPRHGGEALQLMAETGRLCRKDDFSPLLLAAARPATVGWRASGDGRQLPVLLPEPAASLVVPLQAPWYVDLERHQLGPLQVRGNPAVVARLFSLPPLSATAAALVGEAFAESALELPSDPEHARVNMRSVVAEPLPVLRLQTLKTHGNRSWREYPANYGGGLFDVALPVFRYADVEIIPDDARDFSILASGETVRVERRCALEEQWMDELAATGLEKIAGYVLHTFGRPPDNAYGLAEEAYGLSSCAMSWRVCALPVGRSSSPRIFAISARCRGLGRGSRRVGQWLVRSRHGHHRRRRTSAVGAAARRPVPA
jgi:hypothetical protein